MSQGQGSISSNELMKKLVQSKKIMNKVDGGNYERGLEIVKTIKAFGGKVIIDLDDYWVLDQSHGLYHQAKRLDLGLEGIEFAHGFIFISSKLIRLLRVKRN